MEKLHKKCLRIIIIIIIIITNTNHFIRFQDTKRAVVCLGKQPGNNVYVFDSSTIVDSKGKPVENPPVILPGK
jgi:hypothetical protein